MLSNLLRVMDKHHHWSARQLIQLALNDAAAKTQSKKPGIKGEYYKDRNLKKLASTRLDKDLSFFWSWKSPLRGMPRDNFSIRGDGYLEIPEKDKYSFLIMCSDGIRIWVDGRLVVDAWKRANDNFCEGSIELEKGLHNFKVEYFESVGEAGISGVLTADKKRYPLPLEKHIFHIE